MAALVVDGPVVATLVVSITCVRWFPWISVIGAPILVIMALVLIALAAVGIGAIACDW